MIEKQLWYGDTPAGTTDYEYCSFAWPRTSMGLQCGGLYNAGTSTTVLPRVTGGRGIPSVIAANDLIWFQRSGTMTAYKVVANNGDSGLVLSAEVDLSTADQTSWYWQKSSKGITSADGWVGCNYWTDKGVKLSITTLPTGGVNYRVEIKDNLDSLPTLYYAGQITTLLTDLPQTFNVEVPCAAIRVGLERVQAGSDGSISVSLYGNPSR